MRYDRDPIQVVYDPIWGPIQAVYDPVGIRYRLYAILQGSDPDSVRSYGDQIQAARDLVGIGYRVYRTQ